MSLIHAPTDTGMHMRDLLSDDEFRRREPVLRGENRESVALRRLSRLFAEKPEAVLQELVDIAVTLCGADSAGISLEEPEQGTFRWISVSGSFRQYLGGRTLRNHSPCGTCLDTGRPQLYKVTQPFYDQLGVTADAIMDGILIPWTNEFMEGTLWAVSHKSEAAFSFEDYELLSSLGDFAAIILRHQYQAELLREADRAVAVAETAHKIAHRINNPLQSLTNTIYLARHSKVDVVEQLVQAEKDVTALSDEVAKLLKTARQFKPRV